MADLSHISANLQAVEPLDLGDTYPVNRKTPFRLAPKGRYTLQSPSEFPQAAFGATKAGNLIVTIDPTIVGPTNEGFTVRRTRVSAKVYERNGEKVSQLGDYLIAAGYHGPINTVEQQAEAVEQTVGALWQADLDWRAENFGTGFKLEGMAKFPKNSDGTYQSWIEDPTAKDDEGKPKRLLANLYVRNYVPTE